MISKNDFIQIFLHNCFFERNDIVDVRHLVRPRPVFEAQVDGLHDAEFAVEEREGLYVVRAICSSEIDPSRLTEKDTMNYCNILIDGNNRKSILRMHFNGGTKRVEIFDEAEPKFVPLEKVSDIYQQSERIRTALKAKLG